MANSLTSGDVTQGATAQDQHDNVQAGVQLQCTLYTQPEPGESAKAWQRLFRQDRTRQGSMGRDTTVNNAACNGG